MRIPILVVDSSLDNSIMSKQYIFVYGTLKTGEFNWDRLKRQGHQLGTSIGYGRTVKPYPLVLATKFLAPFLLDVPGVGKHVKGEVLEVDDETLAIYDRLEGIPVTYERGQLEVRMLTESTNQNKDDNAAANDNPGLNNQNNESTNESAGYKDSAPIMCYSYMLKSYRKDLLEGPFLDEYKLPHASFEEHWDFLRKQGHSREIMMIEQLLAKGLTYEEAKVKAKEVPAFQLPMK